MRKLGSGEWSSFKFRPVVKVFLLSRAIEASIGEPAGSLTAASGPVYYTRNWVKKLSKRVLCPAFPLLFFRRPSILVLVAAVPVPAV